MKKILKIIQVILFIIIIICLWNIINWYLNNIHTSQSLKEIEEIANIKEVDIKVKNDFQVKGLNINFDELLLKNKDTIAWLRVNGTNINYPVVQATDNSFYLDHSFDKSANSAGWVFADYRNDFMKLDKNNIIYAHSRLNGSMFATLKNALEKKWCDCEENRYILLSTLKENLIWEVFSVYTIPAESFYTSTYFQSDEEYIKFLNTIKQRSIYNFNVDLTKEDKILTLSTCNNLNNSGRIVMHAKLLQI